MPILTPKTVSLVFLLSVGQEVSSFLIQIPEALLMEAQRRAVNFGIQYVGIAVAQSAASACVDLAAPHQLFLKGVESMSSASTPVEAATRGSLAAAVLILSSVSAEDFNTSLAFGEFLVILCKNILFTGPGSQCCVPHQLVKVYLIKKLTIRIINEIQVELMRRKLKLPIKLPKVKFNLFKQKKKKKFIFKTIRFKKRTFNIFARKISLYLPYEKNIVIKPKKIAMVKPIFL